MNQLFPGDIKEKVGSRLKKKINFLLNKYESPFDTSLPVINSIFIHKDFVCQKVESSRSKPINKYFCKALSSLGVSYMFELDPFQREFNYYKMTLACKRPKQEFSVVLP